VISSDLLLPPEELPCAEAEGDGAGGEEEELRPRARLRPCPCALETNLVRTRRRLDSADALKAFREGVRAETWGWRCGGGRRWWLDRVGSAGPRGEEAVPAAAQPAAKGFGEGRRRHVCLYDCGEPTPRPPWLQIFLSSGICLECFCKKDDETRFIVE
jgi:hypothetical protein